MEKEPKKEIFVAIVAIAVVFLGFTPTIDNWFVSIGLCLKGNVQCSTLWTIIYVLTILIVVSIFAYFLIFRPNARKKELENTPSNPSFPPKVDMSAEIDNGKYQGVSGDNANVTYDNSKHFHFGKDESGQTKSQNTVIHPEINVEAPFTVMPAFAVVKFRIENKNPKKVTACYVKLNVTEVHINENGIMLHPYPEGLYPKKILWSGISIDGNLDLRPNAPEYLSVLELGQEHFRFLFQGDKPLKTGTREPEYFSESQTEWLSHIYYTIELILFCDDINNESVRIENKFALSFNVAKHKEPSCQMVIKKIESYEDVPKNIEAYFLGQSHSPWNMQVDNLIPPANSQPLTPKSSFQIELTFDYNGNLLSDKNEINALASEAVFAVENGATAIPVINIAEINMLENTLRDFENRELTPQERITKVEILKQVNYLYKQKERLEQSIKVIFTEPVFSYCSKSDYMSHIWVGLGKCAMGRTWRDGKDIFVPLDIWYSKNDKISTVVLVDLSNNEERVKYRNFIGSGWDLYDLPDYIMFEYGIPAIILEYLQQKEQKKFENLDEILHLSKWSIGLR